MNAVVRMHVCMCRDDRSLLHVDADTAAAAVGGGGGVGLVGHGAERSKSLQVGAAVRARCEENSRMVCARATLSRAHLTEHWRRQRLAGGWASRNPNRAPCSGATGRTD